MVDGLYFQENIKGANLDGNSTAVPCFATIWSNFDRAKDTVQLRFRQIHYIKSICINASLFDSSVMGRIENYIDKADKPYFVKLYNGDPYPYTTDKNEKTRLIKQRWEWLPYEVVPMTIGESKYIGIGTGLVFVLNNVVYYEVEIVPNGDMLYYFGSYLLDRLRSNRQALGEIKAGKGVAVPQHNGLYTLGNIAERSADGTTIHKFTNATDFFVFDSNTYTYKYLLRTFGRQDRDPFRCFVRESDIAKATTNEPPKEDNQNTNNNSKTKKSNISLILGGAILLWTLTGK